MLFVLARLLPSGHFGKLKLTTTNCEGNKMAKTYVLNDNGFTEQDSYDLERLIDRRGIQMVLQEISEICGGKAEHIAHNWQDTGLAKRWATVEGAVGVASTKANGL